MPNVKNDPIISRTYHIKSSALDNFEKVVTAVKKHARNNNLPPINRGQLLEKIFDNLKGKDKTPADFFN